MTQPNHTIELTGLDGSSPLAFLASRGVLRCLDLQSPANRPRLSWSTTFRPTIDPGQPFGRAELTDAVKRGIIAVAEHGTRFGNIVGVPVDDYRRFADPASADPRQLEGRVRMTFAAAFASDAIADAKKATVVPTALSFSNGQGGKLLLKDFRTLVGRLTVERLSAALFEPWQYDDRDVPTFRWDPLDMRTGAHMATDPGSTETRSVMAANALAFVGLSFLPVFPADDTLRTTMVRRIDGELCFAWPLWRPSVSADVAASLLQRTEWTDANGVIAQFASRRIMFKKNLYLGSSFTF